MAAQHLHAIGSVGMVTGAEIEGMELGSKEVVFRPRGNKGGKFDVNIGTAGSITLLLQCMMPVAMYADRATEISITGGTDVAWSPPIDFLRFVLLPVLNRMGIRASIELVRRGYYPKGGGLVRARMYPSTPGGIRIKVDNEIRGISHCSMLPKKVAIRQANAAERVLRANRYDATIEIECKNHTSTGSGITLWCGAKSGSSLGARGKPAERVGEEAASILISELNSNSSVDVHMVDQLIPYMAFSDIKNKITVRELTGHIKTNIWVVEHFLPDVKFKVDVGRITSIQR